VIRRALIATLLALTAATTAAAATPRTTFNAVEKDVMCVSCGVPLEIAESPQADRERVEIRRLIAQGLTKKQVEAELVKTYGDRVLAKPKSSGFGLAAYLVPLAIVIGALTLLAVLLPRWRRARQDALIATAQTNGHATSKLTPDDLERLAEDLAHYDV
jgi:cytochrome c-type biogenesis protein CcmH